MLQEKLLQDFWFLTSPCYLGIEGEGEWEMIIPSSFPMYFFFDPCVWDLLMLN